jgi:hypothetical protein
METAWRQGAIDILERITGSKARNFASYDFGRRRNPNCVSVIVHAQQVGDFLETVRAELPQGLVAFIGINWGLCWITAKTEEQSGYELVVGPGESQFDIFGLARPDENNYQHDIVQLRKYNDEFGIDLFLVTSDEIAFQLLSKPTDLDAFAKDLLAYCPDLCADSEEPLQELRTHLENAKNISLWWD